MKNENVPAAELSETTIMPTVEEVSSHEKALVNRRSFMTHSLVAGAAATVGAGILANSNFAVAQGASRKLTKGDVAILQFLAAAEIIESDLWLQYQELGGVQDDEVATLADHRNQGEIRMVAGPQNRLFFTFSTSRYPASILICSWSAICTI